MLNLCTGSLYGGNGWYLMALKQNRVVLGPWCTWSVQGCIDRYLVVLSQFWIVLVVVRTWRYWFSRGRHRVLCLYILEKMEIWSDVTDLSQTHNFER